MGAFLIAAGMFGYGVSMVLFVLSPAVADHELSMVLSINSTIFFVGGVIVAKIPREKING